MRRTLTGLLIFATATLLGATGVAHAGGWAVITMDPLVDSPVENQPLSVGFTILQHGVTPYTTDKAFIIVTDGTGRTERFAAKPAGQPGHHIAEVTFAGSGVYRWEVQPDWFAMQPLGEVAVASATAAPTDASANTTTTTTTREPIALTLRVLLAVALALAIVLVMAEFKTAQRRVTT